MNTWKFFRWAIWIWKMDSSHIAPLIYEMGFDRTWRPLTPRINENVSLWSIYKSKHEAELTTWDWIKSCSCVFFFSCYLFFFFFGSCCLWYLFNKMVAPYFIGVFYIIGDGTFVSPYTSCIKYVHTDNKTVITKPLYKLIQWDHLVNFSN